MFRKIAAHVVVACGLWSGASNAADYNAMYVFGDSLSDRGNLSEAVGAKWVDPPSFHYSFTNGPVAVSVLADKLGLTADASLWYNGFTDDNGLFPPGYQPGTNYAVADATAQAKTPRGLEGINLTDQVTAYMLHSNKVADSTALYTILIGGNDVANATRQGDAATALPAAIAAEINAVTTLASAGARSFLIANIPDVGATPAFAGGDPALAAAATTNAERYDALLARVLGGLRLGDGVKIRLFDFLGSERGILANAASYGITDTTGYCYDLGLPPTDPADVKTTAACGPNAENIDRMAYWNNFHPTAKVHALIGQGMFDTLNAAPLATPEPATWAMLVVGFALTGSALRRRRLIITSRHPCNFTN